jgi:hypothetical protein
MSRASVGRAKLPVDDHPRTDQRPQPEAWRRSLRTDWLPVALIAGDAVIAGAAVLIGYALRYRLGETQSLDVRPYFAALPAVVLIYPRCSCWLRSPCSTSASSTPA